MFIPTTELLQVVNATPSGYEIGYVQSTTDIPIAAGTSEAAPSDVLSLGAINFDGAAVIIEFYAPGAIPDGPSDTLLIFNLWDSTTNLCRIAAHIGNSTLAVIGPTFGCIRLTPSVGTHTYSVKANKGAGASAINLKGGTGSGGATTYAPIWLRVVKI